MHVLQLHGKPLNLIVLACLRVHVGWFVWCVDVCVTVCPRLRVYLLADVGDCENKSNVQNDLAHVVIIPKYVVTPLHSSWKPPRNGPCIPIVESTFFPLLFVLPCGRPFLENNYFPLCLCCPAGSFFWKITISHFVCVALRAASILKNPVFLFI